MIISNGRRFSDGIAGMVRNYDDQAVHEFYVGKRKPERVCEIIVHESVTRTYDDTIRVLSSKKNKSGKPYTLGVHLLIDGDGNITQHGDLATSWQQHFGAPHNEASVGVELINPYEPRHLREDLPWKESIDAPWAHGGSYVLPTFAQAEAFAQLLDWLLTQSDLGFTVPRVWHGVRDGDFHLQKVRGLEDRVQGGIYSHQQIGRHADGSWPLLYAYLRLERKIAAGPAYEIATVLAMGSRGVVDVEHAPEIAACMF